MSIENPTPGGSFGGDGASTTNSGRNPGGQFSGIGRLGVDGRTLSSTILWIGPEPPAGDGFLLWINTSDGRWYGYWRDGTSTQWVDLSLPFGEGLQGAQGIEGPKGEKGDVGQGIPIGGLTNEILVKASNSDYDTLWGARPADGRTILYDTVDPTTEGEDDDFFINTATNTLFGPKAGGTWPAGTSLVGPAGADGADGADGATGATGATGAAGADGVDGNQIIYGVVAPTTEGNDGDTYIDTATDTIYYNKSGGSWPAGVSLIGPAGPAGADGADGADGATGATGATGPAGADGADGADGNTVLYGSVDPTTEGVDDDFYINTVTNFIFGPKSGGTWPAGTSLVGPAGEDGAGGGGTVIETYTDLEGFRVELSTGTVTSTASTADVVFDNTIVDTYGGYDDTTGIYTVPAELDGRYMMFTANLSNIGPGDSGAYIQKDGSSIAACGKGSDALQGATTLFVGPYLVSTGDEFNVQSQSLGTETLETEPNVNFGGFALPASFKGFHAYKASTQGITSAGAAIVYDTEDFDTDAAFNTANGQYTVPASHNGLYGVFSFGMNYTSAGTHATQLEVSTDSGTSWDPVAGIRTALNAFQGGSQSLSDPLLLNTGDIYRVFTDPTASETLAANRRNHFGMFTLPSFTGFSAERITSAQTISDGVAIYNQENLDSNDSYDETTGKFTVPATLNGAVFVFNAGSATNTSDDESRLTIQRSQDDGVSFENVGSSAVEPPFGGSGVNTATTGPIILTTGEIFQVNIETEASHDLSADPRSFFSGFLVNTVSNGDLGELDDVETFGAADKDVLEYNSSSGKWVLRDASPSMRGFKARKTSGSTVNAVQTTIVFDTEDYDTESAYNAATGEFTVPASLDGTYMMFHAGMRAAVDGTIYITKGGTKVAEAHANPHRSAISWGPELMSTGDVITVDHFANGVQAFDTNTTFFSGYVVNS